MGRKYCCVFFPLNLIQKSNFPLGLPRAKLSLKFLRRWLFSNLKSFKVFKSHSSSIFNLMKTMKLFGPRVRHRNPTLFRGSKPLPIKVIRLGQQIILCKIAFSDLVSKEDRNVLKTKIPCKFFENIPELLSFSFHLVALRIRGEGIIAALSLLVAGG